MTKVQAHNLKAALIIFLVCGAGYCLGGRIGLGIGLILTLLMQIM